MNRERIAPALGKVTSGLYIATAMDGGAPIGMLCSFVEQAGFEPPMLSIALGPGRPLLAALERGDRFGLNILSKANGALVKPFSRSDAADPFAGLALVDNACGLPQLADAWAFLACEPRGRMEAGDHVLFLAEVVDGALQHSGQEPMIRVRTNGFGY